MVVKSKKTSQKGGAGPTSRVMKKQRMPIPPDQVPFSKNGTRSL